MRHRTCDLVTTSLTSRDVTNYHQLQLLIRLKTQQYSVKLNDNFMATTTSLLSLPDILYPDLFVPRHFVP